MTGADSNIVNNVASELATQMKRIPLIANVISETSLDRPELRIQPRADLAARLGVSTESLSQTIRVATIGDVGPALAKFDAGDRLVPIRVQLEDDARGDLQMLRAVARAARPARREGRRAAVGRRRHQARPGPDQHQPLRPRAAGHRRRRPRRHRRARRRHQEDLRTAGHEEPAEGRQGRARRATPKASTNCRKALPPRSPPA